MLNDLQHRVGIWVRELFPGGERDHERRVRAQRVVEESLELALASGINWVRLNEIVKAVLDEQQRRYGHEGHMNGTIKPGGERAIEAASVLTCLCAYAEHDQFSLQIAAEEVFASNNTPERKAEIRAKNATKFTTN